MEFQRSAQLSLRQIGSSWQRNSQSYHRAFRTSGSDRQIMGDLGVAIRCLGLAAPHIGGHHSFGLLGGVVVAKKYVTVTMVCHGDSVML